MELTITAEIRHHVILLTVEHGQAERVQTLELRHAEMLAAIAVAENAANTSETVSVRYPGGLP